MKSIEHRTENTQTKSIIINLNLKLLSEAMRTLNEIQKKHYQTILNHHTNVAKFDNLASIVNPLINTWGVYLISSILEEKVLFERERCLLNNLTISKILRRRNIFSFTKKCKKLNLQRKPL